MPTDNAVYELIHGSQQFGMDIENVYFYQRGTGISAGAQALAEEWQEQVLPAIQQIRAVDQVTQGIYVRNLFDPTDVYTIIMSEGGEGSAGDMLPPFNAVNFTLAREDHTTRNGSKRYGTLYETSQEDGIINASGFLSDLASLANDISKVILGTLDAQWFFPVIVKRILEGEDYRLPETLAEATINAIVDAVFNPDISSQGSRKYGNGA